ncbi:glycoside hydrolase, family 13, partial [Kipferlia bialata]
VWLKTKDGRAIFRLPQHCRATRLEGNEMVSLFWNPPGEFTHYFKHQSPPKPDVLKIYEAHVGMATEDERCGGYREFADNLLPTIAAK